MYPELFQIPGTSVTVKSYGLMLAVGFLAALWVMQKLAKKAGHNPHNISNIALYALISGVIGARIFYVIHYFEQFDSKIMSIFAIWQGGLELLGGFLFGLLVILIYMRFQKLPVRKYLDIFAIAMMIALSFGRIGCFLNGCCFGKPTDAPWSVEFPYGSLVYKNQVYSDPQRNRSEPYIQLPDEYFGYSNENGDYYPGLKPYDMLTEQQKEQVKTKYHCLAVHPTQLYSSLNAAIIAFVLFLLWRRGVKYKSQSRIKPGTVSAIMLILYGTARFGIEFLRDDNPYELDGLTVSQNISITLFVAGVILLILFQKIPINKG